MPSRPLRCDIRVVLFQVEHAEIQVALWQHRLGELAGLWALPGGRLDDAQDLDAAVAHQLLTKTNISAPVHQEQLMVSGRSAAEDGCGNRVVTVGYLALRPFTDGSTLPPDTAWFPLSALPDLVASNREFIDAAHARLRAKLSYSTIALALTPPEFTLSQLRDIYRSGLGYPIDTTNLQRILLRRGVIEPTGGHRSPGKGGGRPGALFRFTRHTVEITDEFATLRPPP